jgi:hypothetical protein
VYWSVGTEDGIAGRWEDRSGRRKRSDEAEWLALYSALWCVPSFAEPGQSVVIKLDCRIIVHVLNRHRTPSAGRVQGLYRAARHLLEQLAADGYVVRLEWVERAEVKKVLGH